MGKIGTADNNLLHEVMKNTKDRRYATVRNLITAGYITAFREIFDTLPKTVVATDLAINNNRFSYLMLNTEYFHLYQLFNIADLLEISHEKMLDLVLTQHQLDQKSRAAPGHRAVPMRFFEK